MPAPCKDPRGDERMFRKRLCSRAPSRHSCRTLSCRAGASHAVRVDFVYCFQRSCVHRASQDPRPRTSGPGRMQSRQGRSRERPPLRRGQPDSAGPHEDMPFARSLHSDLRLGSQRIQPGTAAMTALRPNPAWRSTLCASNIEPDSPLTVNRRGWSIARAGTTPRCRSSAPATARRGSARQPRYTVIADAVGGAHDRCSEAPEDEDKHGTCTRHRAACLWAFEA